MRRLAAVLFLVGALLLPACTDPAGPSAGSPTPDATTALPGAAGPDTRDDLTVVRAAFDRGFAERTFAMGAQVRAGGQHVLKIDAAVDAEADVVKMVMMTDEYTELLRFGDEIFLKQTDAPGPDTFLRVEFGKLNAQSPLRGAFDLTRHSGVLGGVTRVRKTGDEPGEHIYEGTVDLRKAMEAAPAEARVRWNRPFGWPVTATRCRSGSRSTTGAA